jgi:hypothetical protein
MADLWTPPGSGSGIWTPDGTQAPAKPAPHPNSPANLEAEVLQDVYDHEVAMLQDVFEKVAERYEFLPATEENLGDMVNEFVGRAAEAGFRVNVSFEYDVQQGIEIKVPVFSIVSRIEKGHEFDIERQQWEVQNDVLGIDETPGAMKADGTIKSPSKSVSMSGSDKPKE